MASALPPEVSVSLCCLCGSSLELVTTAEDAMWLMIYRFSDAHAPCGFVMSSNEAPAVTPQRMSVTLPVEDQPEYTGVIDPDDPPEAQIPSDS